MKNRLLLLLVLIATFGYAQNVTIPDAFFKNALVTDPAINTNGDSEISFAEAAAYTDLINLANNFSIADLTGIEAFVNLRYLYCWNNQITSLDLSANTALTILQCGQNQITSLDLSANTALTILTCSENSLTSLDVSANTALTRLDCYKNSLTSLDVSANTALKNLLFYENPITSIDVSVNTALEYLFFNDTQLTSINLSTNTALKGVKAYDVPLTSLDLSAQPNLQELLCNDNSQLTSLNVANGNNGSILSSVDATNNTALTCIQVDAAIVGTTPTGWSKDAGATYSASCSTCTVNIPDANFKTYLVGNTAINTNGDTEIQCSEATSFTGSIDCPNENISDLTGIEAFTALTELFCYYNQLTSLDVSANTALEILSPFGNPITSIDVSANTALIGLDLQFTSITSLDVSANTALTTLSFSGNPITSIDLSANTALEDLFFNDTQLTSIDLSTNTDLKWIEAHDVQLTSLDLSAQPNLEELYCYNNSQLTSLNIANGNNANMYYFNATNNTALTCIEVDAAIVGTTPTGWSKDAGATYSASCTACTVNIPDANFKTYLVGNTAINTNGDTEIQCSEATAFTGSINCSSLSISDLTGIEAFVNITVLVCSNNNLTSIDISAILNLGELYCSDNQLTSLNTSLNTGLYSLSCANNALTSIDLSSHPNINTLYCNGNNITTLNLSNLTGLYDLNCSDNQITSIDASNIPLQYFDCQNNALTSLNVANGNNFNIVDFFTTNNPNLTCIEVDDVAYSTTNWTSIDAQTSFSTNCTACTVNIPDANFKAYLVGNTAINTNGDTEIQCSEASAYTGAIVAASLNISDLTGIEAFTEITRLQAFSNDLTTVDLSQNTKITQLLLENNNNLAGFLDLSAMTSLTDFKAHTTLIERINVANGNNTNFSRFECYSNASLTCVQIDAGFSITAVWSVDDNSVFSENCYSLSTLSFVNEIKVSLYPNPTTSVLNIKMDSNLKHATIYSILGTKVLETSSKNIKTSNLKRGFYLIKIEDENGNLTTKRFMKE